MDIEKQKGNCKLRIVRSFFLIWANSGCWVTSLKAISARRSQVISSIWLVKYFHQKHLLWVSPFVQMQFYGVPIFSAMRHSHCQRQAYRNRLSAQTSSIFWRHVTSPKRRGNGGVLTPKWFWFKISQTNMFWRRAQNNSFLTPYQGTQRWLHEQMEVFLDGLMLRSINKKKRNP